ncbi:unnamed protein product [Camellia sinensis]
MTRTVVFVGTIDGSEQDEKILRVEEEESKLGYGSKQPESLQPTRGVAETLCGSPLYMAPEIMQLQSYDPKADLWSVGAILFQLVTGNTPFTGNNQIQQSLLKKAICGHTNSEKAPSKIKVPDPKAFAGNRSAKELENFLWDMEQYFKAAHVPEGEKVTITSMYLTGDAKLWWLEQLTFEEFFNHPFLSLRQSDEFTKNHRWFFLSESNPVRSAEESSQEDCLPFILDDDSSGPDGSPSFVRRPSMKSTYGFSLDTKVDRKEVFNTSNNMDRTSKNSIVTHTGFRIGSHRSSSPQTKDQLADSLKLVYQDYVIVSGPPTDVSSSLVSASKPSHLPRKLENPQEESAYFNTTPSAPMPIIGAVGSRLGRVGSLDSHSSTPSGTSHGSMDIGDALEQPSLHCMTRMKSLQWAASAITELVNKKKIEPGRQLEAFSIQLVILAIWKQALHICHTQAASAIEGSPSREMARLRESTNQEHGSPDIANTQGPQDICSQIEREFLLEVGNAEELAKVIAPGNTEMPDAMETIYQSALALGRRGAVDEYMGDTENAAVYYSKAVRLLVFLLVEAPSLILNPPFCLTESDRYRLRNYIDVLNNRQSHSRSQRMALFKSEDQQCPP